MFPIKLFLDKFNETNSTIFSISTRIYCEKLSLERSMLFRSNYTLVLNIFFEPFHIKNAFKLYICLVANIDKIQMSFIVT